MVRPEFIHDTGLIEHEKVHVKQFWRTLGLNGLFYLLSKKKRLQYEVEAFHKQLEFAHDRDAAKELFSTYLVSNYNLNITKDEAHRLLDR